MKLVSIHEDVRLWPYHAKDAAGIDLRACEEVRYNLGDVIVVDTGVVAYWRTPHPNNYVTIYPRSSLFKRTGLILVNHVPIIDSNYCGYDADKDEYDTIKLQLLSLKPSERMYLERGERIVQAIVHSPDFSDIPGPMDCANYKWESNRLCRLESSRQECLEQIRKNKARGGFGTTGKI